MAEKTKETENLKPIIHPMAPRLVTIASAVNETLLLSAATYPQAANGPVTFSQMMTSSPWQPFTWWVLNPVMSNRAVFQILFFASGNNLCLEAAGTTSGSNLQLAAVTPASQSQLWLLDDGKTTPQHIKNRGVPGTEFGFPHDIPLHGMELQIIDSPETNASGDTFIIRDVVL